MPKLKFSPQTAVCVFAFLILITFISYYSVPPLVDFQGHLALGMVKSSFLSQYYQYEFSIVYHLFDTIVRFWTLVLGNHYTHVALVCYFSLISLIFSTVYIFLLLQGCSYRRAFDVIAILAGPMFLLLHCYGFIWGVIPYTLAVFMAAASGAIIWKINNDIRTIHTFSLKIAIVFLIYTCLAIFSHAAGFLYLGIAWIIPLIRIISTKQYSKKRFFFLIPLILIITCLAFFTQFTHFNSNALFTELSNRMHWLLTGGPYDFSFLIPDSEVAWFANTPFRIILTALPCIIVVLLLAFRKKGDSWTLFLISQILFQLIFEIIVVDNFGNDQGNLRYLHARHWLFLSAWTFMGIAYLLNRCRPLLFKVLCYLSPVLMALSLYFITPLYANFRAVPIEEQANHSTQLLITAVENYRHTHPEMANKTVVIEYKSHSMRSHWNLYHLVPFLVLLSPDLAQHNIVVYAHWCQSCYFPPLQWKTPKANSVVYLHWAQETNDKIKLK